MTKPFVPQSYKSFRIDGYDIEGGVFHGRYTMCGADSADDVSFAETVDFGDIQKEVGIDGPFVGVIQLWVFRRKIVIDETQSLAVRCHQRTVGGRWKRPILLFRKSVIVASLRRLTVSRTIVLLRLSLPLGRTVCRGIAI